MLRMDAIKVIFDDAKRQQLNDPTAWAARQAGLDHASAGLDFVNRPRFAPEQTLRGAGRLPAKPVCKRNTCRRTTRRNRVEQELVYLQS